MGYYSGTIQKGSQGDDVKKWQQYLNSQGYSLGVDGIFGDKTLAATTEWQGKNGLGADGIVGEKTWGKAGFSNLNNPVSAPTIGNAPTAPELNYNAFNSTTDGGTLSKAKNDAYSAFTGYGDPNWDKQGQADELLNSILNRKDFSYDFNADAIYQQYKDKYIQQGKMAMADAMGQASAMTGGYGNSYAASVGNQAYQAQLNNLNDVIPELYQMAYNRYNQEGQDLYNQHGLLMQDYDKYMNEYNLGYNKLKDAYDAANGAYYNEASLYGTEQDRANSLQQQNFENAYNKWVTESDNAWKQAEWDESIRRYEKENAIPDVLVSDTPKTGKIASRYGATGKNTKVEAEEEKPKGWKDHDTGELAQNQEKKGGSYYSTARKAVDIMISQGADSSKLMAYAQEMVGNSYLSKSEYMTLVQYIRNKR